MVALTGMSATEAAETREAAVISLFFSKKALSSLRNAFSFSFTATE
jgi:hypothetical protein